MSSSRSEADESGPASTSSRPPPMRKALPVRATRGQRLSAAEVEAGSGDEEFWGQDFFQDEGEQDDEYKTESEPEDQVDSDFELSEGASSSDNDDRAVDREPRKKTVRPPGYEKPTKPRPAHKAPHQAVSPAKGVAGPSSDLPTGHALLEYQAPTLRETTRLRMLLAEEQRQEQLAAKPKRRFRASQDTRPLTQQELLEEAANTEIENTKSLQALVAAEKASRLSATTKKAKFMGPMVHFHSRMVDGAPLTTLEVLNMQTPLVLRASTAVAYPVKPVCVITGLPAKYIDPQTRMPYANLQAYREIKRRQAAR